MIGRLGSRILLGLGGLVGALVLLEGILQLAALFIAPAGPGRDGQPALPGAEPVRILCLGESTTHGFGQTSYPTLLSEALETRIPEVPFEVINAGLPGTHSRYIASQAAALVEEYDPHWVIAMMGINDGVFFTDFETSSDASAWQALLLRLRVYKLGRIMWANLRARFAPTTPEADGVEDREHLRSYRRKFNRVRAAWFASHRADAARGFQELIDAARGAGVVRPDGTLAIPAPYWFVYENAQRLRIEFLVEQGRQAEALALARESTRLHPRQARLRRRLLWLLERAGYTQELAAEQRALEKIDQEQELRITVASWQQLLAALRMSQAQLVALQYPLRAIDNLRSLLGGADEVIYVENVDNFREALSRYEWDQIFIDRFAGDFGHASELGNRLIAERLMEAVFLPRYGEKHERGSSSQ